MSFINYFNTLFEERRRRAPQDDLVSGLLAVHEEGDRLSEEELRSIVMLLFLAGHETTMNLIGNGMVACMANREQWQRLVADPALAASHGRGVPPLRRPGAPDRPHRVHRASRSAARSCPRARRWSRSSPPRTATRRRYDDPDRFDIGRDRQPAPDVQPRHPLLPGRGARPARGPGRASTELARRYPDLHLACAPEALERREHFVFGGLASLFRRSR